MSGSWPITRAEELIEVLDHLRVPVNSDERAKRLGDVPYYGANGQQGWIDRPLFNEPLVLLAEDGGNFDDFRTRPIAYRIDGPAWVNNHAHIIRALAGVDQDFVFWSLVHRDIRRYIAGGTRSKLTQAELRSIELLTPPLPEQRRIAEILDTLDEAIRKTEQVIAKLQQMKQGLLHDLLTRGIDEHGELRDPERHPEQFKDSPLGRIPRGWIHSRLEDLVEVLDHLRVPVNSDERAKRLGDVPYYGANGQQGWIDRPLFDEPLVLLAEDGGNFDDFRTRSIAYRIDGPAWVNNHAHIIRALAGVDQDFIFWSVVHKDIRRYIAGGTRSKLTQAELRSIEVATPPLPEQRRIAQLLDVHMARTKKEAAQADKLRTLKHGLMDDLLTGRVRVAVPSGATT